MTGAVDTSLQRIASTVHSSRQPENHVSTSTVITTISKSVSDARMNEKKKTEEKNPTNYGPPARASTTTPEYRRSIREYMSLSPTVQRIATVFQWKYRTGFIHESDVFALHQYGAPLYPCLTRSWLAWRHASLALS